MPLNIKEFESKVLKVKQETQEIKSFRFLVPADFSYKPAQHIALELNLNGKAQIKSFSIASSPLQKGYIEIAKRIGESEYSQKLMKLEQGDTVKIKGPYGMFLLQEDKDAVMLSGGIGITPLRDMIQYATEKKLPIKITLIFSNKTPEEIPYKQEFDELQKKNPKLKVIHTITRSEESKEAAKWKGETGHIDADMIKKHASNYTAAIFYICGPPGMVNAMLEILKQMEIPAERIKIERFTGYP